MSERAYPTSQPSRVRATTFRAEETTAFIAGRPRAVGGDGRGYVAAVRAYDVPLRQRLIDEGLLRPDRNEPLAPDHRDRLFVVHIPSWMPVFRRWPRREVLA